MERNRKNVSFVNDTFTNSYPVIEGTVVGLYNDYLDYSRFMIMITYQPPMVKELIFFL